MKIYLGADHRGFELKGKIKKWLFEGQYEFVDMGAMAQVSTDDYTIYAQAVADMIVKNPGSYGILICGSGVGVDVTANKFDGIRASIGKNADQVKAGRHDDDMNILVIAADFTKDNETKDMLKVFLETKFANLERFNKRLQDIKKIEESN